MSVIDLAPELLKAKYVLISWSDGLHASAIVDDKELDTYMKDGSMDDGDVLLTITKAQVIRVKQVAEVSLDVPNLTQKEKQE